MNGRVYDPELGRMLSPDPVTSAPDNAQAYNRYAYVLNNPLRFVDPSGYCPAYELGYLACMEEVLVTAPRIPAGPSYSGSLSGIGSYDVPFGYPYSFGFQSYDFLGFADWTVEDWEAAFDQLADDSNDNDPKDDDIVGASEFMSQTGAALREFLDENESLLGGTGDELFDQLMGEIQAHVRDIVENGQTVGLVLEGQLAAGSGLVAGGILALDRNGVSVFVYAGVAAGTAVGGAVSVGAVTYPGPRNGLSGFGGAFDITIAPFGLGYQGEALFAGSATGGYAGFAVGTYLGASVEFTYTGTLISYTFPQ